MPVKNTKEAGYTLVELLCTLSIMGMLISLAVPNLSTVIAKATYLQLRYQIISQLEDAQLTAMAREIEVSVQFSNRTITTWVDGKTQYKTILPEDVKISSNYKENRVLFRKTGQVRGGTIHIKKNEKNWMDVVIQVASGTTKVIFHV
ncbi:prepilin-type N-terminal cleavage/methylation domain-containing protein [Shimazuella sp. AN120528]|uniref:prepilin-type N-terminal cleavage/methylation domain-containing protein n=1 Tax=Shimazuella soli TaxID=1892854 RepID=UPI001F0E999A|nr:prepilin-type N-terminal cleavage/methylation domain-containing protein [Shimazuella soli]MCH5583916.1 prepilin-type N-terminal cleavage/methylation domain-containing protein [Shimazuella soli]